MYIAGASPPSSGVILFVGISLIYYYLTGIGMILKTKWGYILFKTFLYLALLAFPIGTVISYITLSYIKKNNIKQYFGLNTRV
jgi:putative copper export protein